MIKPIGGLDKNLLEGVVRIITSHKKVDKIILYGSRAGERVKRASDIDHASAHGPEVRCGASGRAEKTGFGGRHP